MGALGCGPPEALQVELPGGELARAITDGQPDQEHPSVGILLAGGSTSCDAPVLTGSICTATLVGKRTVLTAAHCILPGKQHIFCLRPGGATFKAKQLIQHPAWSAKDLKNDIGLVLLSEAPGVTPAVISTHAPYKNLKITIVGFGITKDGQNDAGTKRRATNTIATLEPTRFSYLGTGSGQGSTCKGDSGGPAFASLGGGEVQVGVTSAGLNPCGTLAYDTRVDAFAGWLKATAGGDLHDGSVEDTEEPVVSITAPGPGATVSSSVTVATMVSDNVGVRGVRLYVDGALRAEKTSPPYAFPTALTDGQHALKVIAADEAGNRGEAKIAIRVGGAAGAPATRGYGESCDSHDDCQSYLCANRTFCTATCDPADNTCPAAAACLPAGGELYVCGPPPKADLPGEGDEAAQVGCAVGGEGAPSALALLLPGLLLLLVVRRRRPSRRR